MTVWNKIITDFDPEEETANFGTRNALEAFGNLYDVTTFATIEPQEVVEEIPGVISDAKERIALALNECLHVLSEECKDVVSIKFGSDIKFVAWSPCNKFVLVGLGSGAIQLMFVPLKYPLPAIGITEPENMVGGCFLQDSRGEASRIVVSSKDGKVHKSPFLNFCELSEALLNNDLETLKSFQAKMQFRPEFAIEGPATSLSVSSDFLSTKHIVLVSPGSIAHLDNQASVPIEAFGEGEFVQVRPSQVEKNLLFCLDSNGNLHVICTQTMIHIKSFEGFNIREFSLLEDEGGSTLKVILTSWDSEDDQLSLEIREFPSFDVMYCLKVTSFCRLVDCYVNQESPLFLEGSFDDLAIRTIRLRGICEGNPESRLARLLRRNKFEEALRFAETFKLNKEQVYQSKAKWLLEEISPWKQRCSPEREEALFEDLYTTLRLLEDFNFLVKCCINAALPTIDQTKKLLLFARESIRNNIDKDVSISLMVIVSNAIKRLETLSRAFDDPMVEDWVSFCRANMLSECRGYLEKGNLKAALLIWLRHQPEIAEELTLEEIGDMLESIPPNWSVDTQLRWLKHFIPECLKLIPESLGLISKWAVNSTKRLQVTARKQWPEQGLKFAEEIISSMQFSQGLEDLHSSRIQLALNQQRNDPTSDLSEFVHLIDTIRDLCVLHKDFRLKISLEDFIQPDKKVVSFLLLDWCIDAEEINALIPGFLVPFFQRNDLHESEVLSSYIKHMIEVTGFTWHWHGAAPWEVKTVAILPFVASIDDKMTCILEAVKSAPVPWSQSIKDLCEEGSRMPHSLAVLIKEQETLVQLKHILRKYDCRTYSPSGRNAERLLRYIIVSGRDEAFEDAKEVAKALSGLDETIAVEYQVVHLLRQNDLNGIIQVLKDCVEGVEEVIENLFAHMATMFRCNDERVLEEQYIVLLAYMSGVVESQILQEMICELRDKCAIAKEFGIDAKVEGPSDKIEIVQGFLENEMEKTESYEDLCAVYKRCNRLVFLLKLPEDYDAINDMILCLLRSKKGKLAMHLAKMLISNNEKDVARKTYPLLQLILQSNDELATNDEIDELSGVLKVLARKMVTNCHVNELSQSLEVSKWQHIIDQIHKQIHNKNVFANTSVELDFYSQWRFSNMFQEKGLPLDRSYFEIPVALMRSVCSSSAESHPYLTGSLGEKHLAEGVIETNEADVTMAQPNIEGAQELQMLCIKLSENSLAVKNLLQGSSHFQVAFQTSQAVSVPLVSLALSCGQDFAQKLFEKWAVIRYKLLQSLVVKILSDRKADFILALACLGTEGPKNGLKILASANSTFGVDYSKLFSLAGLGTHFCKVSELEQQKKQFEELYIRAAWGKKAAEGRASSAFKELITKSSENRSAALEQIVQMANVSIDDLCMFAKAFSFDENAVMMVYAQRWLLSSDNEDVENIKENVTKVLERIDNEVVRRDFLLEMFQKVSPYNHEVLGILITQLLPWSNEYSLVSRADTVLGFLLKYKRVSRPTEKEIDLWIKERSAPFPVEIAETRLPINLFISLQNKEKFRLLEKEFTLETYKMWCEVSKVVGISADNICIQSVQNTIQKVCDVSQMTAKEWNPSSVHESLLKDVQSCVMDISDPVKATSCAHWIVNRLPRGADKVFAANGCRVLAKTWNDSKNSSDSRSGLAFATKTHLQLVTEQILTKYQLNKPQYMDCIRQSEPAELIQKLYEDESIIERCKVAGGHFPNINGAAHEIAEKYGISYENVIFELLGKWLQASSDAGGGVDETISDFRLNLNHGDDPSDSADVDNVNFLRCVYIMQDCTSDGLHYLLSLIYSNDASISLRLRALKCLLSVATASAVEDLTGRKFSELKMTFQDLFFMGRLESLNLPYNLNSFSKCDKTLLIESILRSCGHSPEGIALAVDLAITFEVFTVALWPGLLKKMVQLSLVHHLETALLALNRQAHLWHDSSVLEGWNFLLCHPFLRASIPLGAEEKAACMHALALVNKCPLVGDLDLNVIRGECMRLKIAVNDDFVSEIV